MTLFTIFAAILNKSITDVKEESAGAAEIVGVMDIVLKSAKSALAFVPSVGKNKTVDEKNENWSKYHFLSIRLMSWVLFFFYVHGFFYIIGLCL